MIHENYLFTVAKAPPIKRDRWPWAGNGLREKENKNHSFISIIEMLILFASVIITSTGGTGWCHVFLSSYRMTAFCTRMDRQGAVLLRKLFGVSLVSNFTLTSLSRTCPQGL